jgi:hypothetical protein
MAYIGNLLFGLFILLLAVIGTFTGKTYGKGGMAYRSNNPIDYWMMLIIEYLAAAFFIGCWINNRLG